MPFDPQGKYSLPPSYFATGGQTIRTEQHNPPLEDIAAALSNVLLRDGRAGMTADLDFGTFKGINLAPGVNATDAATVAQASVPIGTIIDWAGDTAPAGWFMCYGQAISRTDYATLFAVCGTKYGAGNGSTTFNLPDLRGRVTAGKDNMGGTDAARLSVLFGAAARTLGGVMGVVQHVLTLAQTPAHSHTGTTNTAGNHRHDVPVAGTASGSGYPVLSGNETTQVETSTAGNHSHTVTTNSQGGGEAHPNAQPTFIVNKLIKATL